MDVKPLQAQGAALRIAEQLARGLLDKYPQDKQAAVRRLKMHIAQGDISREELSKHWPGFCYSAYFRFMYLKNEAVRILRKLRFET